MAKKDGKLKVHLSVVSEFKKFVLRGNVIDLTVGVIIGGAFNKIVSSLTNDILMPVLSLIIGSESLNSKFIALDGNSYESVAEAGSAPLLKYGNFITTALDFLLMGFVIFFIVKLFSFLRAKLIGDKQPPPTEKTCPYCIMKVNAKASICPHCTSKLDSQAQ